MKLTVEPCSVSHVTEAAVVIFVYFISLNVYLFRLRNLRFSSITQLQSQNPEEQKHMIETDQSLKLH